MRACRRGDARFPGETGLWRPATVTLLLVPLGLAGDSSAVGRLAVVAAVPLIAAVLVVAGSPSLRWAHAWIALFIALLLVSFAFPQVRPDAAAAPSSRIGGALGPLREIAPAQLTRLSDLAGLLAGLGALCLAVASAPHARQVARMVALSGTAIAGYVLVLGGFDNGRLEGLGYNPNYLGFVLVAPIVAAAGLVRYTRNPRWLLPAALCLVALSATHSRSAFLAAVVGVVLVAGQGRSRRFLAVSGSVAVAVAATATATGLLRPIGRHIADLGAGGRAATDLQTSNGLRERVAGFAVHVIAEHPLRGIGYSMFPVHARRSPEFGSYLATHDDYLAVAAEAGIPALLVLVALLWLGIGRRRSGDQATLRALVLAYAVMLFFGNPLVRIAVSVPFWIALGCLLATRPPVTIPWPVRVFRSRRERSG